MTTGEMAPQKMSSVAPRDLFLAFFKIGVQGFGGVLPWARRVLVEERKWFSEEQFLDAWGLAQALPGGNIINLSIGFGSRCAGPSGALAAFFELTLAGGYLITLGAGSSTAAYILIGITVLASLLTRLHPIWFIGLGALAGLLGWI